MGRTLKPAHPRVYLTGRICVEAGGRRAHESLFHSRQARLLFAGLVLDRNRFVPQGELAELLWPGGLPAAWDSSLKALVSRLRSFLGQILPERSGITGQFGCYRLELPGESWIDWEAARASLDLAEGAARKADWRRAWGPANVAIAIARRGFLPGEDGTWVCRKRRDLEELLLRGLDVYADASMASGQIPLAVESSERAIALEPFRETSYQRLMRAHAAAGNRAEALRAFHRCRRLLREELGVVPSPETEAVYLGILRSGSQTREPHFSMDRP